MSAGHLHNVPELHWHAARNESKPTWPQREGTIKSFVELQY